jgi:hypothetical protein
MNDSLADPNNQLTAQLHCANCAAILQGEFCHVCGQSRQSSSRFFGSILMELLDNLFSYDSRVYRTFIPLLLKPGFVCAEYLSGKRASYLPPFRLYLFASIVFFLLIPLVNDISVSFNTEDEQGTVITLNNEETDSNIFVKKERREVNRDIPYFIEEREILREKLTNISDYNADDLLETSLNSLPKLMFFLLPLLALTLKLFYLFSKRYYIEHLIVVLYSQSVLFFMLLFAIALEKLQQTVLDAFPSLVFFHTLFYVLVTLVYLWIPAHIFFFLKKVYGQSTVMTAAKFSVISIIYLILIGLAVVITIIWGVLKL